jgi:TetR/AcrR family transcriptional regulator, tetracycline repressor protein
VSPKTIERTELGRTTIVDRALEIADIEGRDAITIRRLAQEFGVTPMALYWHVSNKDELLAAMGDRYFDGLTYDPRGSWTEQLRRVMTMIVDSLRRHPASAHLAAARLLQCETGRDIAEAALGMLKTQGFSAAQATDIGRTAVQTAAMLVTEQAGAEPGVPLAQREAVREAKRAALVALPADRYPNLRDCAATITECDDEDAYYAFGIDLFVTGVEQLRRRVRAQSKP